MVKEQELIWSQRELSVRVAVIVREFDFVP